MEWRLAACIAVLVVTEAAQVRDSGWTKEEKTDTFRGTHYLQFALSGRFLTPPKQAEASPRLVVQCLPGEHSVGYHIFTNGRRIASYLIVGPVLNSSSAA
jgi:hypothetical protein